MTLTEFLLARYAEDEEHGRSLMRQWHDVGNACQSCGTDGARVLAEVAAKRRIVTAVQRWIDAGYVTLDHLLFALALPYADHPAYREEWRP